MMFSIVKTLYQSIRDFFIWVHVNYDHRPFTQEEMIAYYDDDNHHPEEMTNDITTPLNQIAINPNISSDYFDFHLFIEE